MNAHTYVRWYCPRCGIVRDEDVEKHRSVDGVPPPFCRHNTLDLPAESMVPIKAGHPYATGRLPWGDSDPHESGAA